MEPVGSVVVSNVQFAARSLEGVEHEHGDGHGSYAAGDGGDVGAERGHVVEVHVAGEAEAFGYEVAKREVLEKALRQGIQSSPMVELGKKQIKSCADDSGVLFETWITAVATEE